MDKHFASNSKCLTLFDKPFFFAENNDLHKVNNMLGSSQQNFHQEYLMLNQTSEQHATPGQIDLNFLNSPEFDNYKLIVTSFDNDNVETSDK